MKPQAEPSGRTMTPEEYQNVANAVCQHIHGMMESAIQCLPKNPDGSKDAGPVIQGALSAAIQWVMFGDPDAEKALATIRELAGHIAPQIAFAMTVGTDQVSGNG